MAGLLARIESKAHAADLTKLCFRDAIVNILPEEVDQLVPLLLVVLDDPGVSGRLLVAERHLHNLEEDEDIEEGDGGGLMSLSSSLSQQSSF